MLPKKCLQCDLTKLNINGRSDSVTFTLTGVSGDGLQYDAAQNENAVSFTVAKPQP